MPALGGCFDASDALVGSWHPSPESTSTRLLVLCLTSTVHAQSHRHLIGIWLLSAVVIANSLLHCLSYPTPFPAYLGSVLLVPGISHASGISLTFCFLLPCPETGSTTKPARIFHLSSPFPHMGLPSQNPLL